MQVSKNYANYASPTLLMFELQVDSDWARDSESAGPGPATRLGNRDDSEVPARSSRRQRSFI